MPLQGTEGWLHLVVQVPSLVVLLHALPAEDGLVVYLDELPLRAVTEMSKKAAEIKNKDQGVSLKLEETDRKTPLCRRDGKNSTST